MIDIFKNYLLPYSLYFNCYLYVTSKFAPGEQILVPTTVWFIFSSALVLKYSSLVFIILL